MSSCQQVKTCWACTLPVDCIFSFTIISDFLLANDRNLNYSSAKLSGWSVKTLVAQNPSIILLACYSLYLFCLSGLIQLWKLFRKLFFMATDWKELVMSETFHTAIGFWAIRAQFLSLLFKHFTEIEIVEIERVIVTLPVPFSFPIFPFCSCCNKLIYRQDLGSFQPGISSARYRLASIYNCPVMIRSLSSCPRVP